MTAPTFTSITPATGHPGGKYLVVIQGTDFQLHPDPPATGPTSRVLEPSMEVEIDGRQASNVRVFSSTLLTCNVPAFKGDPSDLATGHDVDVVLTNLGPPEEDVTETDGFEFKRVSLARGDDAGALNRIVRELIQDLRRQVIDNVAIATGTDFDDSVGDSLNIVAIAEAPGIALFGPTVAQNRLYRSQEKPQSRDVPGQQYEKFRAHYVVDLRFQAVLVGKDDPAEIINLIESFMLFFRDSTTMEIDIHPTEPAQGSVELELWLTQEPDASNTANRDNIFLAPSRFEIRGVPLDRDSWQRIRWGKILDDPADVVLEYEQRESS